jgi:hypothetical protein
MRGRRQRLTTFQGLSLRNEDMLQKLTKRLRAPEVPLESCPPTLGNREPIEKGMHYTQITDFDTELF